MAHIEGASPARAHKRSDITDDDARLAQLGYRRNLSRRVSAFGNAAFSAAIISPITGIMYGVPLVMMAGGPMLMVWGWLFAGLMVLTVGAAMAEINSLYPTSAGLYYSAGRLAKRHNAAWSWFTGWLNYAGQIGGTASADFAAAVFLQALIALQWPTYTATPARTLGWFAVFLLLHALANTLAVRAVAFMNKVAVWWLGLGTVVIAGCLLTAHHHTSTSFALTHFANTTGISSAPYAAGIGLLFSMGCFTGFDASYHMSEETNGAAIAAPRGIVRSIAFSLAIGTVLVVALAYAMVKYDAEATAGLPPMQILLDSVGSGGAKIVMVVTIGAMWFCGLANMTSNSRQIFAFSRDGAIPGWRMWRRLNPRSKTPENAVWFATASAFVLGLPSLWNSTAFTAIVSINVIGLFTAYVIPVFLRLRHDTVERGPWSLGRWSRPLARIAVAWVLVCSIIFLLPEQWPITATNFNYAPIVLAAVLLAAALWWLATARRTYKPPTLGDPEAMAEAEEAIA
jgi:amino acid transporter